MKQYVYYTFINGKETNNIKLNQRDETTDC